MGYRSDVERGVRGPPVEIHTHLVHEPAESECTFGDIHLPPLLWYYVSEISSSPSRRNFRVIDQRRDKPARLFTIFTWVSVRPTPSILVQALNSKLCSPMLLIVVRHGSHIGWHDLPQAPKEGFIVDRKAIDCSVDVSWDQDVLKRHRSLLLVDDISLVLTRGATLIKA